MPATEFICPDGGRIPIKQCLRDRGCRASQRCASRSYLNIVAGVRKYRGVSPSMAANSAREIYLKATTDYAININSSVWSTFGTILHAELEKYPIEKALTEVKLKDDWISGTADLVEPDETKKGYHILVDHKFFGSYHVQKILGISVNKVRIPALDKNGNEVYYKSGTKTGQLKTKNYNEKTINRAMARKELHGVSLQQNCYRMVLEANNYKISRMQLQVFVRDGGTFSAKNNGIDNNIMMIDIPRIRNEEVKTFYNYLERDVDKAFETGYSNICTSEQSWDGRKCALCEVEEACKMMDRKAGKLIVR